MGAPTVAAAKAFDRLVLRTGTVVVLVLECVRDGDFDSPTPGGSAAIRTAIDLGLIKRNTLHVAEYDEEHDDGADDTRKHRSWAPLLLTQAGESWLRAAARLAAAGEVL